MKGAVRVTDDTGRDAAAERTGRGAGPEAAASAGEGSAVQPETPAALIQALAPRGRLRRFVGGTVLVEGAVLVAAAVFLVVELFRETPTETGGAVAQVVIAVVIGLGLLQLGRVVLRADERARIPVLVWQLLQASAGVPALSSNRVVAVVLLSTAAVAGIGVLVPGVLRPDVRGLDRD